MDKRKFELILRGSIMGYLVGDALAYPYKDAPIESIPKPAFITMNKKAENQKYPGIYTNHGSTMLCVMAAINDYGEMDERSILEFLRDWHMGGFLTSKDSDHECMDIDVPTTQSIRNFLNNMPPETCASVEPEHSLGNGALLRSLPIALNYFHQPEEMMKYSMAISKITHSSISSQVCCCLLAVVVRNLLLNKRDKIFEFCQKYFEKNDLTEHVEQLQRIKDSRDIGVPTEIAVGTFWAAWDAFTKHPEDFRRCVTTAIRQGGDTSATAALAGGLAGIACGLYRIPGDWLKVLRIGDQAEGHIDVFVNKLITKLGMYAEAKEKKDV